MAAKKAKKKTTKTAKKNVYTLGYEGISILQYIDILRENKVTTVCDVRNNPFSFKFGFSKKKFSELLSKHDIEYIHYKNIGVKSALRKKAKGPVSRKRMFEYFNNVILEQPEAYTDLDEIIKKLSTDTIVLTCFERDPCDCHRSYVANKIKKILQNKINIIDLNPPDNSENL
jgi:uncharacterized protein (DUF488 family)